MTRVVIEDGRIIAALVESQDRTEICDAEGRVLGVFVPRAAESTVYYKGAKSPFPREEVERRFREEAKDARPLSEFWAEMQRKHPDKFQ
jgi:hypothetical protein